MRRIALVTVGRSDWGLYRPIARQIRDDPALELVIVAGGMHLDPAFGSTVEVIEADGFTVNERVELLDDLDTPTGVATSMGRGTIGFAQAFERLHPDLVLVLGDRFEMHAAAVAAMPSLVPVAHIHGGELTEGAIDDALRHSITKLSHLHFVATETYRRRVEQLGEEPWRVTVSGAPGLDNLREVELSERSELEERLGLPLDRPTLLVTHHPVTLEPEHAEADLDALFGAIADAGMQVVFTAPNADVGGRAALDRMQRFADGRDGAVFAANLGSADYFGLMRGAVAMVGNSSSGIIEAASLSLPVVNIGSRQEGRLRPRNVIDVGSSREEILTGIRQATEPAFRSGLEGLTNPYGDGHAAERIVARLRDVELGPALLRKRFHDLP